MQHAHHLSPTAGCFTVAWMPQSQSVKALRTTPQHRIANYQSKNRPKSRGKTEKRGGPNLSRALGKAHQRSGGTSRLGKLARESAKLDKKSSARFKRSARVI